MKKLTFLFALLLLPLLASANDSGTCGDNLTYTYVESTHTLTISGTGEMTKYNENMPWYSYRDKIKKVVIKKGVESIGSCAFYGCESMASISIANTVKTIGNAAFVYCTSLTSLTIPNSVSSIELQAFYGCSNLASLTIPKSVNTIEYGAFMHCSSLSSVVFPNSVFNIGADVFWGCGSLTSVTAYNTLNISWSVFDEEACKSATLYVPKGRKDIFQESSIWGKFSSIVEKDMADAEADSNPFDNLYSKRLILSYTSNDEDGGSFGSNPNDIFKHAIMFPVDRMKRIKGNQITYIKFRMWHANVTNMKVWIGTDKDKRDLVCQNVTNLKEGWNEVALEHPYTITGEQIFVGVDYCTDEFCLPLQWDSRAGDDTGGCYMYRMFNKWETTEGTWYIQCMVEGETIPKNDIHVVELAGPTYKRAIKPGEAYECTLKLRNWGSMPIEKYEIQALLNGKEVKCSPSWNQIIARGGGTQEIELLVTPGEGTKAGNKKLTIKPKMLNGETYNCSDAPKELTMKVYEHDMGRQKVLIQNYTGTHCGYCPEFDGLIEQKMKERSDLVLLSVHTYDEYETEASKSYEQMHYRNGIPDVDLNRCVWQTPYNYRDITMIYHLDDAKNQPSFANVNIVNHYNDNYRTVYITVSGERNEDFVPVEEWTNLTVLLVEDNVLGYQLSSDLSPNYPHNGVIRTNVSAIWGDKVQWNGDKYEMHYSAKLDDAWNKDNVRVVAFLSKPFTGDNYDEINIVNCNEQYVVAHTGIQDMSLKPASDDIYDLNGRKIRENSHSLEGLPEGVYIIRGKKVVK